MTETRQIVVPGDVVATTDDLLPGQNTYLEGREIRALRLGVKTVRGDRVNVISLNGRYEPFRGDMVIGTVVELGPSNWYINVGAANDVGMHVNDVPWRVEFGETSKYLDIGDTVLLKIVHVDEMKKAQVSMKDRQCRKLTGGLIWEVSPSKVPRIVGRNGSMIALLKDYTSVRIFVGQNGVVWLDGEAEDVKLALEALHKIEAEAHTTGLTDRMKAWLEERRPGAAERKRAAEVEARGDEEEFRPAERRPRPKVDRTDEEEYEAERPPRREREDRGERRGPPERRGGDRERGGGFRERDERPRARAEPVDERPPRRPRLDEPEEERPRRRLRDEVEDEEERPVRRRASDAEERPARRSLRDEVERPARVARDADEDEEPVGRPARRFRDGDEEDEGRPAGRGFREGGREGRFGGRSRSEDEGEPRRFGGGGGGGGAGGSGGGRGRRRGGRGRGRGGSGRREE